MAYLDFNTLVICNNDFSEDFLAECFFFFHELGVQNFIFTYDFDAVGRSLPEGIRTLRSLKPYLHRFQVRGTRVYTAFNVILEQGVSHNKEIVQRLSLPHTDRIFINLPLFTGHEWLEADLAHLVYRKHRQPVFTSFERNVITYTDDMLERFSRLPKSIFCLDANYLFSLRSQTKLENLLKANVHILPCISNSMSDYVAVSEGYADLKRRIGTSYYRDLCNSFRESGLLLRKDFTTRSHS